MMFRRVNTCSVHERSLLKPACSSRRVRSTASCSLFSSTLLKTLPGVESSVIPRQLLQSLRLTFFGSLIITPFFQSSGISESCHIMLNSSTCYCSATVSLPCLSISADISSTPGALLFVRLFTARWTSSMLMCPSYTLATVYLSVCRSSSGEVWWNTRRTRVKLT